MCVCEAHAAFRVFVCFSKSKIVQAEYKAKARFLALLRRRRFSRQRKEHRQTPFPFVDSAKLGIKKGCMKQRHAPL